MYLMQCKGENADERSAIWNFVRSRDTEVELSLFV